MEIVLSLLCIVLFPALALRAMRRGGVRSLWRASALGVGLILLTGLVAASSWAGNALAPTYGYAYTAPRTLLLFGLTVALPLISAGLAIRAFAHIGFQSLLYAIGVACGLLGWIVGFFASMRILYAI